MSSNQQYKDYNTRLRKDLKAANLALTKQEKKLTDLSKYLNVVKTKFAGVRLQLDTVIESNTRLRKHTWNGRIISFFLGALVMLAIFYFLTKITLR